MSERRAASAAAAAAANCVRVGYSICRCQLYALTYPRATAAAATMAKFGRSLVSRRPRRLRDNARFSSVQLSS